MSPLIPWKVWYYVEEQKKQVTHSLSVFSTEKDPCQSWARCCSLLQPADVWGEGSIGDRWRGCMLPGCQAAVSTSTGRVKMSCSRDIAKKGITLARNIPIPYTYLATAGNCRSLSSWCRQNISPRVYSGISRRLCAAIMSHSALCQVSQCAAVPSLLVILVNIHYREAACQHASCLHASISVPGKWYLAAPIIFVHVVGNAEINAWTLQEFSSCKS